MVNAARRVDDSYRLVAGTSGVEQATRADHFVEVRQSPYPLRGSSIRWNTHESHLAFSCDIDRAVCADGRCNGTAKASRQQVRRGHGEGCRQKRPLGAIWNQYPLALDIESETIDREPLGPVRQLQK